MAAITAASIKYGQPIRVDLGGLWLTATQIEIPGTTEEYAEGGIELEVGKLGLPANTPGGTNPGFAAVGGGGEAAVGETASTTAIPLLAWTSGQLWEAKTANESGKQVAKSFACAVTSVSKSKLFLRIFSQEAAGIGKEQLEPKTATAVKLKEFTTTIFVLGK